MSVLTQARLAKGLCPLCGMDAAPYRLCARHRQIGLIRRVANRLHTRGYLQKEKKGRENWYHKESHAPALEESVYKEAGPGDGRLKPRLNHVPIDIEQELKALFVKMAGTPITEEEIIGAWQRLRLRKGRISVAHDMATLILAHRKREKRSVR
jgi:hypothetical protein